MPRQQHVEVHEDEQTGGRRRRPEHIPRLAPQTRGAQRAEGARHQRDGDAERHDRADEGAAENSGDAPPGDRGEGGPGAAHRGGDDEDDGEPAETLPALQHPLDGGGARPRHEGEAERDRGPGAAEMQVAVQQRSRDHDDQADDAAGGEPERAEPGVHGGLAAAGGGLASSDELDGEGGHQADHREVEQRADGAVVRRRQQPTEREDEDVPEHVGEQGGGREHRSEAGERAEPHRHGHVPARGHRAGGTASTAGSGGRSSVSSTARPTAVPSRSLIHAPATQVRPAPPSPPAP